MHTVYEVWLGILKQLDERFVDECRRLQGMRGAAGGA
jgi:hypothetical protein